MPTGGGIVGTTGTRQRGRLTRAVPTALTVLMVVLVVVAAGLVGEFSAEPVLNPTLAPTDPAILPSPSATDTAGAVQGDGERLEISGDTAIAAALILVMAALALLVRFLMRFRTVWPIDERTLEQADLMQPGPLALVADALPAWAEASRVSLEHDADTTDAVIRCWLDFEALCAGAGAPRTPTQTTTDFACAVSVGLGLPPEPLATLNRLYQRARFGRSGSGHSPGPLLPADRRSAMDSVEELSAALATRRRARSVDG